MDDEACRRPPKIELIELRPSRVDVALLETDGSIVTHVTTQAEVPIEEDHDPPANVEREVRR